VKTLKTALILGALFAPTMAAAQDAATVQLKVQVAGFNDVPGFDGLTSIPGVDMNITVGGGGTPNPPSTGPKTPPSTGPKTPTIVRYRTATVSRQSKTAEGYPKETVSSPQLHTVEIFADGSIDASGVVFSGHASAGGKHTVTYNTCTRTTVHKNHIDLQKQDYAVYSDGHEEKSGGQYSAVEAEYPSPSSVTIKC
jgi:hypothetical protein